jgi:hypothetical protein
MKMLVAFSFQIVKKDNFWSANAAGWGDIKRRSPKTSSPIHPYLNDSGYTRCRTPQTKHG